MIKINNLKTISSYKFIRYFINTDIVYFIIDGNLINEYVFGESNFIAYNRANKNNCVMYMFNFKEYKKQLGFKKIKEIIEKENIKPGVFVT